MVSQAPQIAPALLEAAARLLARDEARFSIAALAREAGLSRSSIYRAFPNRQALIQKLQESGVEIGTVGASGRILAAAMRTYEDLGLQGATVEEIARRAGVAPVTVYRLFGDRTQLLDAALQAASPRRAARRLVLRPSAHLEQDLAGFAATALSFIADHAGVFRLALGAPRAEQSRLQEIRQAPRGTVAALTRWFAHQMGAGRIAEEDPHLLAVAFMGMLLSFAYVAPVFEDLPLQDPAATGRTITRLFLHGVARARGRRR